MMFGLGGLAFERWIGSKSRYILPFLIVINTMVMPIALPILPVKSMKEYSKFRQTKLNFTGPFRWEDGEI